VYVFSPAGSSIKRRLHHLFFSLSFFFWRLVV
jgi:hypothetical protein